MNRVPKVAAINDISGIGRCSITVTMPIVSALGCQVCPLPTAILSNQSEYNYFYFYDFTDHMEEYFNNWKKIDAKFDCVYSGFIGSEKQINIIIEIIEKIKEDSNALIIVDPVMGDDGVVYKTYTDEMIEKMSKLVKKADIITPNLTEAGLLLNEKNVGEIISINKVKKYLNELCSMGPSIALITGITTDEGEHINACFNKKTNEYWKIPYDHIQIRYPGTGDLFSSLFTGYLLNGISLPKAIERASIFVSKAVLTTYELKTPSLEGVVFEKIMKELYVEPEIYKYSKL